MNVVSGGTFLNQSMPSCSAEKDNQMRCFIYRNLNRKGHTYSFKALEGKHKGRVVAYAESFLVKDVTFHVSQAGWERCIREQRRNVHAGIVGDVVLLSNPVNRLSHNIDVGPVFPGKGGEYVSYNPYKTNGTFVTGLTGSRTHQPVHKADRIEVLRNLILAHNAT